MANTTVPVWDMTRQQLTAWIAYLDEVEPANATIALQLQRDLETAWLTLAELDETVPHVGHWSRLGGIYWCDTCNSPYCDLA